MKDKDLIFRFNEAAEKKERNMKRVVFSVLALLCLGLTGLASAQTSHIVLVGGVSNTFSPANLTIDVGDTVVWMNQSGFHNVVADDNSFTSGAPSSGSWVFSLVFTEVGANPYYCSVHGDVGGVGMSGTITVESVVGVDEPVSGPARQFTLKQNYPNPFNPSTTIGFSVPETPTPVFVTLGVYNLLGQRVRTLIRQKLPSGVYSVIWDAQNDAGITVPSGVYFYRLDAANFSEIRKMTFLR